MDGRRRPGGALEITGAKRVGGALCLDFVNTVRGRSVGTGARNGTHGSGHVIGERLVSYEALLEWGVLAGALTAAHARTMRREALTKSRQAGAVLARSVASRETIYRIVKAATAGRAPSARDLDVLNAELRIGRAHERLIALPRVAWAWEEESLALDRVLWPIVRSAADLLTSADLTRVRQCPGDECGWLFLDLSRAGRRQWCDMADCGNVAKVRRFRERQRPPV